MASSTEQVPMSETTKRGPGRPRDDDPLLGQRIGYRRLMARWPGITRTEAEAAIEEVRSGRVPDDATARRWVLGVKLKLPHDLAVARVLAERADVPLGELWAEALRAWLELRGVER